MQNNCAGCLKRPTTLLAENSPIAKGHFQY